MLALRSLAFNLAFFAWTAVLVLVSLPLLLAPPQALVVMARFWARSMNVLLRRIVGLDWQLRGAEHLPEGPFILAIKHQSMWDTLMYVLFVDDPAIVLKRELLSIPLFGWYLGRTGQIAIDRKAGGGALRRLLRAAARAAEAGRPIIIAPEGTRTAPGQRRPYQPGVAALYGQLGLPVVPAALNAGLFWRRRSFVKRPGRITVEFLPAMPPGLDRATFMAELERRIESAAERLRREAEAEFSLSEAPARAS